MASTRAVNDADVAWAYQRLTAHEPGRPPREDPRLVRRFRPMEWDRKPPQFKTYPGAPVFPLPAELSSDLSGQTDVGLLGRLLYLSAGVVRVVESGGETLWFRAAGSAGNLSPVEVYLVTGDQPGLGAGVYHYEPVGHGLVHLRSVPPATPPSLVLTGVPWRTCWKYAERGWRHLYWDAGTMLAQVLAVAQEAGVAARVEVGFVDAEVAALVGADAVHEVPLAVVVLGDSTVLPDPEPVPRGHLADEPLEFPLVTAVQRAGDLTDRSAVAAWRRAAAAFSTEPATTVAPPLAEPVHDVVRLRGSTRRFDAARVAPAELLTGALSWATAAVPGDFTAAGATLLEHNVAVHAVAGVEAGAYRWRAGELVVVATGAVRDVAAYLCLGQELGGQGAYTVFHCTDLDALLPALGSRGYRAAQLEAGVVEGRLHLAAFARHYGATGLTFYDDEVRRFFATKASPLLATAIGAPAYRSVPGGLPGRPTRLSAR